MKKQLFKFLPLIAAVFFATSCSKDDETHASDSGKPQSGIPFSIRVNTGNSLKKLGYAESTDPNKVGYYNISFTDDDKDKLEMKIYNGVELLTTLKLTNVAACEFTGSIESEPDEDAKLTAVITTGNDQSPTYSDLSLEDLLNNCRHIFKTQNTFKYGTEEIFLTDQNTYLAISMSPFCEHKIEINNNSYTVKDGRIWVAVPSGEAVNSEGFGSELNKQAKEVESGKIYTVARQYFTVAKGKKVYFSKGNLQYNVGSAAQTKWCFAPTQYDKCFATGDHPSSSGYITTDLAGWNGHNGYIDLFGWGTWTKNGMLDPNSTNIDYKQYRTGVGDEEKDFENVCKKEITDVLGTGWETLTTAEFQYLFNHGNYTNEIRSDKYGVAQVAGVNGMVLLPDDWTKTPDGVTIFKPGVNSDYKFESQNKYSAEDWAKMESAGAVFLPAAGTRYGTRVESVGGYGYYWSASANDEDCAYYLCFNAGGVNPSGSFRRNYGSSVRLVRALQ